MARKNKNLSYIISSGKSELVRGDRSYIVTVDDIPGCTRKCPAGVNVKSYLGLVANRQYGRALEVVREKNPFPGICGRACTHPCESACLRSDYDESLSIRALKRFIADFEIPREGQPPARLPITRSGKIAVIGSGPAGLACALDLLEMGYAVTVFEALERPGGVLAWGIPDYRLPPEIVRREIGLIQSKGVEIATNRRISSPSSLLREGFSAVVVAAGAWRDLPLGIPGENQENIVGCLAFLRNIKKGEIREVKGKVIVIGGGDSAMDAARSSIRLGAEKVTVAYRRTEDEMPADKAEIDAARAEGVEILFLAIPKRALGDGKLRGVEFLRAKLGDEDASGRRRPVPVEGSEFTIECDWLIPAVSSKPEIPDGWKELSLTSAGLLSVGSDFQTSTNNIYAVGDIVRGPSTIVDVIGDAHACAIAVHNGLENGRKPVAKSSPSPFLSVEIGFSSKTRRGQEPEAGPHERVRSFAEISSGYSESLAIAEASRCRSCGACSECEICFPNCSYKLAELKSRGQEFKIKLPAALAAEIHGGDEKWEIRSEGQSIPARISSLTPRIRNSLCIACGRCEEACAYRAVKIETKRGGKSFASIDHDACRTCGRCAPACPTGAIILKRTGGSSLGRAISNSIASNSGVAVFSCFWAGLESEKKAESAVELMCITGLSANMIIEALHLGAKGVIIFPCPHDREHYLGIGTTIDQTANLAKKILALANIAEDRILVSYSRDQQKAIGEFSGRTGRLPAPEKNPPDSARNQNTFARTLAHIAALSKTENDESIHSLELKAAVWNAAGFPFLSHTCAAIRSLLETMSPKDLPEKLDERSFFATETPPPSGKTILAVLGKSVPASLETEPLKVGVLEDRTGSFSSGAVEILKKIKGLEVKQMDSGLSSSDFGNPDSRARSKVMRMLKAADRQGIGIVVPVSVEQLSLLSLCNDPARWSFSPVRTMDLYSLLIKLLKTAEPPGMR